MFEDIKELKSTLIQWNLDLTNLYLYNKVLDITNDFLFPNSRKYMKKNLDIMNYSEQNNVVSPLALC